MLPSKRPLSTLNALPPPPLCSDSGSETSYQGTHDTVPLKGEAAVSGSETECIPIPPFPCREISPNPPSLQELRRQPQPTKRQRMECKREVLPRKENVISDDEKRKLLTEVDKADLINMIINLTSPEKNKSDNSQRFPEREWRTEQASFNPSLRGNSNIEPGCTTCEIRDDFKSMITCLQCKYLAHAYYFGHTWQGLQTRRCLDSEGKEVEGLNDGEKKVKLEESEEISIWNKMDEEEEMESKDQKIEMKSKGQENEMKSKKPNLRFKIQVKCKPNKHVGRVVEYLHQKNISKRKMLEEMSKSATAAIRTREDSSSSSYRGVSKPKGYDKYIVKLFYKGKSRHFACFECPAVAARAYNRVIKDLFPHDAKRHLNEVTGGELSSASEYDQKSWKILLRKISTLVS